MAKKIDSITVAKTLAILWALGMVGGFVWWGVKDEMKKIKAKGEEVTIKKIWLR